MDNAAHLREVRSAWCAVLAGFLFAATLWYGNNMMNFVFTWGPQGVALVVMLLMRARPAAIAGAALAFTGFLGLFRWWVLSLQHVDGLVWLLYLFSLPGGIVGAIAATVWLRRRESLTPAAGGSAAAAFVIAGIVINMLLLQATT